VENAGIKKNNQKCKTSAWFFEWCEKGKTYKRLFFFSKSKFNYSVLKKDENNQVLLIPGVQKMVFTAAK